MATKPVKVLTDLLTRKQVIKQDLDGNILFKISGSLNNGTVSSSLPRYCILRLNICLCRKFWYFC